MRFYLGIGLLFALAGMGSAQDTSFPTGPQYLMTFGSPMFARPLTTPSLSWENPLPAAATSEAGTSPVSAEQYEGVSSILESQRQTTLYSIYYGAPTVNLSDISFRESGDEASAQTLPAGVVEIGVTSLTDAQALREQGYGITLPEAATLRKATTSHAHHIYTNEDLERLRPSN